MASIDIAKMEPAALMGLDVHFENSIRMRAKHSNFEIDTSRTDQNYFLGCTSWRDAADRIGDFVQQTDERQPPKRVRKDRKTWLSIYIPCPKAISDLGPEAERQFFEEVYALLDMEIPSGLFGGVIHLDEQHTYKDHYDKETKEWIDAESLNHGHYWAAAYTPEKGINCSTLCSPEFFKHLQDAVQAMVMEQFGISYQTGDYKRTKDQARYKKTVEELKLQSTQYEVQAVQQQLDNITAKISEKQNELQQVTDSTIQAKEALSEAENTLSDVQAEINQKTTEKSWLEKVSDGIIRFMTEVWNQFTSAYTTARMFGTENELQILGPAEIRVKKAKKKVAEVQEEVKETGTATQDHLDTINWAIRETEEVSEELAKMIDSDGDDKDL